MKTDEIKKDQNLFHFKHRYTAGLTQELGAGGVANQTNSAACMPFSKL